MIGTPRICDLIKQGKVDELKDVMEKSEQQGMKTFDAALYDLYKQGRISYEEALKNADSKNNLRLRIQLSEENNLVEQEIFDEEEDDMLSLVEKEDRGILFSR